MQMNVLRTKQVSHVGNRDELQRQLMSVQRFYQAFSESGAGCAPCRRRTASEREQSVSVCVRRASDGFINTIGRPDRCRSLPSQSRVLTSRRSPAAAARFNITVTGGQHDVDDDDAALVNHSAVTASQTSLPQSVSPSVRPSLCFPTGSALLWPPCVRRFSHLAYLFPPSVAAFRVD